MQTESSNDIVARIDRSLMADQPSRSIMKPVYDLLRQAGTTILDLEAELSQAKSERDLAQRLLIEQCNHHDKQACITWERQ